MAYEVWDVYAYETPVNGCPIKVETKLNGFDTLQEAADYIGQITNWDKQDLSSGKYVIRDTD